jgi:hypothetical protein
VLPSFGTPPVRNIRLRPLPTIQAATVTDNPDRLVSELMSTNIVVEISFVTSHDDQTAYQLGRISADALRP